MFGIGYNFKGIISKPEGEVKEERKPRKGSQGRLNLAPWRSNRVCQPRFGGPLPIA